MNRRQYSIRQLFVAVTIISTSIVVLQLIARNFPSIFVVALVSSFAIGVLGLGIVVFAGLLAFSIYANEDPTDRHENLGRCVNLAVIGLVMTIPLLLAFVVVPLLPRG